MDISEKIKILKALGIDFKNIGKITLGDDYEKCNIIKISCENPSNNDNTAQESRSDEKQEKSEFAPVRSSIKLYCREDYRRLQLAMMALIKNAFIDNNTELKYFIEVFSGEETDKQIKWIHKNDKSTLFYFIKQLYANGYAQKDENGNIPWLTIRSRFVDKDGKTFPDGIRNQSQSGPKKYAETIDNIIGLLDPKMNLENMEDEFSKLFSDIRNEQDGNYRYDY